MSIHFSILLLLVLITFFSNYHSFHISSSNQNNIDIFNPKLISSSSSREIIQQNVDYQIRIANFNELITISKLRIHVFYPQYLTSNEFITSVVDKLRQRISLGSICFVAQSTPTFQSNLNYLPQTVHFGDILGSVEISPNDFMNTPLQSIGSNRKLYLADLCIRHDCRYRGIATYMLREVEDFAIINGYKEIYLHVENHNEIAKNLYKKNGYVEVPMDSRMKEFTESRLIQPVDTLVLLWKEIFFDCLL